MERVSWADQVRNVTLERRDPYWVVAIQSEWKIDEFPRGSPPTHGRNVDQEMIPIDLPTRANTSSTKSSWSEVWVAE